MRARAGGVLSASALVAVGTSLLLAALIGLGISELGTPDRGGASDQMRAEAAAVVVPGTDDAHKSSRHPSRRHSATHATVPQPVLAPSVSSSARAPRPVATRTTVASTRTPAARVTSKTSTPSPSPTRAHGKGKGSGGGQHKPAKH